MPPELKIWNGERSVLTLSSLYLPCYMRDKAWNWKKITIAQSSHPYPHKDRYIDIKIDIIQHNIVQSCTLVLSTHLESVQVKSDTMQTEQQTCIRIRLVFAKLLYVIY